MQIAEIFVKLSLDAQSYANGLTRTARQAADFANQANGAANQSVGAFGRIGQAISNMAQIAGGIIAADLFGKLVGGIKTFALTGLMAVGSAQQLEVSLQSLLTANNMYAQVTTTTTQAITKQLMTQGEYGQKLDELTSKLETQKATYQEQAEKIRQMTDAWGADALNVKKLTAQHEQLAVSIRGTEQDIAGLSTTETEYADVTKTVWQQTMSQADAAKIAAQETKNLMQFVSELAVVSPFETEDVEQVTKYAVAAGLGVDQTKEFSAGFLDLAAAVGIGSDSLGFAADQLFQVKKIGKLTEIDLRQLRRLGIDLAKVLEVEMGMSVEEFNAQASKSPAIFDELFTSITKFSKNTFVGTAQKMALSVKGIQSTISDIFTIGARNFFRPMVDAVSPAAADIVGKLSKLVLGGDMTKMGKQAADMLMKGLGELSKIYNVFSGGGVKIGVQYLLQQMGFNQGTIKTISSWIEKAQKAISSFQKGGLFGNGKNNGLLQAIGLSDETVKTIQFKIAQVKQLFKVFQTEGLFGTTKGGGFLSAIGLSDETIKTIQFRIAQVKQLFNVFEKGGLFGEAGQGGLLAALGLSPETVTALQTVISTITKDVQFLFAAFTSDDMSAVGQVGQLIANQLTIAWTNYVQPQLATWGGQFMNWVGTVYANIPTALTSLVTTISNLLTEYWPTISATLLEWSTKFWDWTIQAALGVGLAMAAIVTALLAWATSADAQIAMSGLGANIGKMIVDGIKLLFQGTEGTGSVLVSLASGLVVGVAGIAGTLIILGGELVAGIVSGILTSLGIDLQPTTFSKLSEILTGIGTNIKTIAAYVGRNIVTGIQNGWNSLVSTIEDAFTTGVASWVKIIAETDWGSLGSNIISGILKGIQDNVTKVYEVIKDMAKNAITEAKKALGISSPSTVFIKIGNNIVTGLTHGVSRTTPAFQSAMKKLLNIDDSILDVNRLIKAAKDGLSKYGRDVLGMSKSKYDMAIKIIRLQMTEHLSEIQAASDPASYLANLVQKGASWKSMNIQKEDVRNLAKAYWANFTAASAEALEEYRQMVIDAMSSGIQIANQFLSVGQTAADRLQSQIDTLTSIVDAGGGEYLGTVLSAVDAQELLNQKLADQLSVQKEINAMAQQQADLQFLQQQVDLLELIQDQGLDAEDILGGITLGLDASLPDLIAATSAVVEAMIDQVDSTLQIASPSKVMEKRGKLIDEGLAKGLADNMSLPVGAMANTSQKIVNQTYNQTIYSNTGIGNTAGAFQQMSAAFST